MGKALSDTEKHLFSVEKPFAGSSSSHEEEEKDSVKNMAAVASSSNQDQFSSAMSGTSTSMLSDDYEE